MDGLFELLILAVFILAPMIDAIKRRSKKGGEDGPVDPGESGKGRSAHRGRSPARRGEGSGETDRREESADRERSAEELVPADLWAVLTGQKQPGGPPDLPDVYRRSDAEEGAASYDDSMEGGEGRDPWQVEEEPAGTTPAVDSTVGSGPEPVDDHSWAEIGQRGEIGSGDRPDFRDEMEELGGLMAARSLQRAGRSLDRSARLGGGMAGAAGVTGGVAGTGSLGSGLSGSGSGVHSFFHELDRDELRRAMVLNEVLGLPLAFRER